ncbi:site-specific recombinase [Methanomassiliicoccales archaeon RumEn M1]|nr:site-specific recombinase [Methanomassiliicoccales archaeon RumEn M1]
MRAAIYARVSTDDQAREGYSIPDQLKRLNAYCKAKGWKVAGEFVDDGYSGRNIDRPAYQRMLEQREDWDVLLVLKMDRIHRNSQNFAAMMDHLNAWKKQFNSMQEKFDTTTAMGRFVMDTIQRIAQLESEQIGERVKIGMVQKAKTASGYLGSGIPYGYDIVEGRLIPIEAEMEVVGHIYRAYMCGCSLSEIAQGLNERGTPTKKGKVWMKQTVSRILRNPLYAGYVVWDDIVFSLGHTAVVTPERFNLIQELMERRRRDPGCAPAHRRVEAANV